MAFTAPPSYALARPAIICHWASVAHLQREVRAIVHQARRGIPASATRAIELGVPLVCLLEHRPFSVAHWLPNMPRGSEQPQGHRAPVIRAVNASRLERR